jgi:hypothetical protein
MVAGRGRVDEIGTVPQERRKREPQTVLTAWLVEILPRVLGYTSKPSRAARPARSADGLIGPARAFAR